MDAASYPVCVDLYDQMLVFLFDPLDPYARKSTMLQSVIPTLAVGEYLSYCQVHN